MLSKIKMIFNTALTKGRKFFSGTGISKIPGVWRIYNFLLFQSLENKNVIEIEGSKLFIDVKTATPAMKAAFRDYATFKGHEQFTTNQFKSVVREGDVIIDCGANIGYFSLLAAKLVGKSGKVYSFEPEPNNFKMLLKNIEINDYRNITPLNKAISNKEERVNLHVSDKDIGAHTIRPQLVDLKFFNTESLDQFVEVDCVVLDDFFKDSGYHVDVIKMDIEGAEMAALEGAKKIIESNKDLKIFMEFYPSAIIGMGNSPEEFARVLLEDYKFSVLAIYDSDKDENPIERIESVKQLMEMCGDNKIVNLYLHKTQN